MTNALESLPAEPQQIVEAGREAITKAAQELTAENMVWALLKTADTTKSLLPEVSISDLPGEAANLANTLNPSLFKSMVLKPSELGQTLRLLKDLQGTRSEGQDKNGTLSVISPADALKMRQDQVEAPRNEVPVEKQDRVRIKTADGEFIQRDGKWIKDEKLHPLKEMYNPKLPFEDENGKRNAMGEQLHQRAEALLKQAANANGEISFPAHGRMLKQIAEMQDLTEAEKLYVYERVLAGRSRGQRPEF